MRRLSLSTWLGLLTVGTVLLVAGALAPVALRLLERQAEENARARVQLAALGAAEAIEGRAATMATAATLLAERPTLSRLLESGEVKALGRYLDRYRAGGELDGVAIWRRGDLLAASPEDLPWQILSDHVSAGGVLVVSHVGLESPLAVGVAAAPSEGDSVMAVERLNEAATARLGEQVGVEVRILRPAENPAGRPAIASEYRGTAVVAGGFTVEALLPRSEVERAVAPLRGGFVLVTAAACLIAVLAGVLAGRRLARPLAALRTAAARIGEGDLTTPIPSPSSAEMAALGSGMDDMRRRLRALTEELRHREADAQALLSGIVEGVFAVDGERRIRYLNDQAAALLGVAAADAVGRFCGDVLRPVGPEGARPCDERCPIVHARSRGSSRSVEHLELAGGRRTVVITAAPPAGTRQVQVLRDETETEAARRTRDAVLANVSHELKTPLSAQLA